VARYTPLLRSRCRRFHLDEIATEDFCQRIWIGLARRLLSFRYDPNGSFRSWLCRYCDSRLIDRLRGRKPHAEISIDDAFGPDGPSDRSDEEPLHGDEAEATDRTWLLTLAAEIHERVRLKVNPDSWQAFWLIAVEDHSVRETADTLGKSYAATFAAQKRVRRLLEDEGRRMLAASADAGSPRRFARCSDPGCSNREREG
jgi:RNA polymerase sigma-70 factor (ECF subfamily)